MRPSGMRAPKLLAVFTFLVPLGALGQATAGPDPVLRLEPGDVVRVEVEGEPELSGDFAVDEEGTALIPLIGLVRVAGVPFPEVREEIRAGFAEELVQPVVTVRPVLRVAVLGEVRAPGLFHLDGTHSLVDALATAGGLTPDADPDGILLVRSNASEHLSLEGAVASADLRLRPGDQIVVGRRSWLSRNYTAVLSVAGSVVAAVLTSLILR